MPLIEELADVSAPGEEHAPSALTPLERRVEKEWEDQLALAKEQEAGADVSDVPVRDLYGEQSVHNYPDVHNDWGDGAHAPLTADATGWNLVAQPGYATLQTQLEAFYFLEADLLDNRRYRAWLDLLADDLTYYMPMRANVPLAHDRSDEFTTAGEGIHWFENDK